MSKKQEHKHKNTSLSRNQRSFDIKFDYLDEMLAEINRSDDTSNTVTGIYLLLAYLYIST